MNRENLFHLRNRIIARIYTKLLSPCFSSIGKKTIVIPPLRFSNLHLIHLGKGVEIQSNCWILAQKNNDTKEYPKIVIKDYAGIGMNATISAAKLITIEEHVLLARNVYISDHGHDYYDISQPIMHQGIRKIAEVRVGANTWLGQNSVILPGVSIGRNCAIGANSVVNQDIPDYSVAVGSPARVTRKYNEATSCWERV